MIYVTTIHRSHGLSEFKVQFNNCVCANCTYGWAINRISLRIKSLPTPEKLAIIRFSQLKLVLRMVYVTTIHRSHGLSEVQKGRKTSFISHRLSSIKLQAQLATVASEAYHDWSGEAADVQLRVNFNAESELLQPALNEIHKFCFQYWYRSRGTCGTGSGAPESVAKLQSWATKEPHTQEERQA